MQLNSLQSLELSEGTVNYLMNQHAATEGRLSGQSPVGAGSFTTGIRRAASGACQCYAICGGGERKPPNSTWGPSLCLYLGSPMTNKQNHMAQHNIVSSWMNIRQVWERWISLIALFLILSTARNVCALCKHTIQIREQWEAVKWLTWKTKHTSEIATVSSSGSYMSIQLGFILPLSLIIIDSLSIPFWAG